MKIVSTAVGVALANSEHLKPVMAPVVMGMRGAMMVLWGTIWKTFLFQVGVGILWIGSGMMIYLLLGNYALLSASSSLVVAFLVFLVTPAVVFISEIFRVRKKLTKEALEKQAATVAAATEIPSTPVYDTQPSAEQQGSDEPTPALMLDTVYDTTGEDDVTSGEFEVLPDYLPERVRATHHLAN